MILLLYLIEGNAINDSHGLNSQFQCTVGADYKIHDSFFKDLGDLAKESSTIIVQGSSQSKSYDVSIYKCVFITCKSKNYAAMKIEGDFSNSICFICLSNCSSGDYAATIYTNVNPKVVLSYITAEYCTSPKKNLYICQSHDIKNINYSCCSVTQVYHYLSLNSWSSGIFTPERTQERSNLSFSNFYKCKSQCSIYYAKEPNSTLNLNAINFINNTIVACGIIYADSPKSDNLNMDIFNCIFQENQYDDKPIFQKRLSQSYRFYLWKNNYIDHKTDNYIINKAEYFTTFTVPPIFQFYMTAKCNVVKPYGKKLKESNVDFYVNSIENAEILMLFSCLSK